MGGLSPDLLIWVSPIVSLDWLGFLLQRQLGGGRGLSRVSLTLGCFWGLLGSCRLPDGMVPLVILYQGLYGRGVSDWVITRLLSISGCQAASHHSSTPLLPGRSLPCSLGCLHFLCCEFLLQPLTLGLFPGLFICAQRKQGFCCPLFSFLFLL